MNGTQNRKPKGTFLEYADDCKSTKMTFTGWLWPRSMHRKSLSAQLLLMSLCIVKVAKLYLGDEIILHAEVQF